MDVCSLVALHQALQLLVSKLTLHTDNLILRMRHLRILARLGQSSKRLTLMEDRAHCVQTARCKILRPSQASLCSGATDFPKACRAITWSPNRWEGSSEELM